MIELVVLPTDRGGWWHNYICPAHGTELAHIGLETGHFPSDGAPCPAGCLIDTPNVRGAWTVLAHRECARRILDAACRGSAADQQQAAVLLEQYADLYAALPAEHADAQAWMLRGRLFHQGLTEAIWAVTIAQAAWKLVEKDVDVPASVFRLLDSLAAAAQEGRDTLVGQDRFTSNYVAWINAAGACCTRDPVWLTGELGMFNHLMAATGEDGWQWEGSTYYHSFVLRAAHAALAALPEVAPPEPLFRRLAAMRSVLTRLQTDSGVLPALHDGPYQSADYDAELAELALEPEHRIDGVTVYADAGYAIVRSHGVHAVVDFGDHGGSHGHRDKLALYLYGPDTAWQPDPGQVPYGHQGWRAHYASTRSHPAFAVDGLEQAECGGILVVHDDDSITVRCDDAYPGVTATRTIRRTATGLSDELILSADAPHDLTLQLRSAVDLDVRLENSTSTRWSGKETLYGRHSCTAAAEFMTFPGPGPADDPRASVRYVDWTAHDVSTAHFHSDYEMRT